jgi:DNA-binding beta-propeller fold protein YncE
MLVFAIVVSAFSAFEMWYVPATDAAYEAQFQGASQSSMASLISQLESPSLSPGTTISQDFQLGIPGSVLSPSQSSSLSFSNSGFNASLSYQLGVNYKLLENTVPTAIQNEVVGTIPGMNGIGPNQIASAYNGTVWVSYITDYASNSIEIVNDATHKLIGNYNVGLHPAGVAVGGTSKYPLLYISNFYRFVSPITTSGPPPHWYNYSTITVFNLTTKSISGTINENGLNLDILFPSGIAYAQNPFLRGVGFLYVSVILQDQSTHEYYAGIVVINTSNPSEYALYDNPTEFANPTMSNLLILSNETNHLMTEVWSTEYNDNCVMVLEGNGNVLLSGSATQEMLQVSSPYGIAYDNYSNAVYVTNSPGLLTGSGLPNGGNFLLAEGTGHGNITVFNGTYLNISKSPGLVNGQLEVNLTEPSSIAAVDPSGGTGSYIYVAGYNLSYNATGGFTYSPIIKSTFTQTAGYSSYPNSLFGSYNFPSGNIQFLQGPDSLSVAGTELVSSDNITENTMFLSNSSGTLSASIVWDNPLDIPVAATYLDGSVYLAVVNDGSDSIVLMNTMSNSVVKDFRVGQQPTSVAYDQSNGFLYVTNNLSNNITVINPSLTKLSLGHTVGNISLNYSDNPSYALYDPNNQSVYVLDNSTGYVTQILYDSTTRSFSTYNFSINLNGVSYASGVSYAHRRGLFPQGAYYNGSEEFRLDAPATINYVQLQLGGTGITGTAKVNISSSNLVAHGTVYDSGSVSVNIPKQPKKGQLVTVPLSLTTLAAGTYFINVNASGLYWLQTLNNTNPTLEKGVIASFFYSGDVLTTSNMPFVYSIGSLPPPNSNLPPNPTSAVMSPVSNVMYVACYGSNSVESIKLSTPLNPFNITYTVGLMPRSIAYDPLDNFMYVANSGSENVSAIDPLNHNRWSFSVGTSSSPAYPLAVVMDVSNGFTYVGNNISNNITLENTFTSQTINNIASGVTPSALVYDSENGFIYVIDVGSNQITIINGGSIYFNKHPGNLREGTYSASGEILSYGYTPFISSVAFHMQDALVLTNYTASKYALSSANVPVSLTNNSGRIYLSSYLLNLIGPDSSVTGQGTNTLLLNVTQYSPNHVFQGQQFTYYDLYGNPYPAMITNISLLYFNYTINSEYSLEIDQILYQEFNGSGSTSANLSSWDFKGYPVHVSMSGNQLSIVNIVNDRYFSLYSVNMVYAGITVVKI